MNPAEIKGSLDLIYECEKVKVNDSRILKG